MPKLYFSKCTKCDFETSVSSGGHIYVLDESGNKVVCPHPIEYHTIANILKISKEDAVAWLQRNYEKISEETRKKIDHGVGINLQHICMDCYSESFLDRKRDEMKCNKCGSSNIKYIEDLTSQTCPKCKEGIIEIINKGTS